jgi:hypothetical protein
MIRVKKTHVIWLAAILAAWHATGSKTVQREEGHPSAPAKPSG